MIQQETAKYEKIWALPEYANYSPGEELAQAFLDMAKPSPFSKIIDIGCGSGKGALALSDYRVTLLDLTRDGLVEEARSLPFVKRSIWESWNGTWDYGYCTDVMEHLPPEYTMLAIKNVLQHCRKAFFQICFLPDHFGQKIGEPLHLTVCPFEWWLAHFKEFGHVIEARDLLQNGIFFVSRPL